MTDQNSTELNQQDVFKYIDQELKSGKGLQIVSQAQKTRSSFKLVLVVNILALIITGSGFLIVNKIFRDQAYQLVGSEKSIKGLEDVLLAELQKKANADLLNKQKELDAIKRQLTDLNSQMDSFKANQEKKLKKQLAEQEEELRKKMQSAMKNKSADEQAAIQKQYQDQLKQLNSQLKEESLKQEEAYKKQLEDQRKNLLASRQQNEKALQEAKTELASAEQEYKQKLQEEKLKGQAALKEVSLKLEERQKIDDFYFQVNSLFQSAIGLYENRQYSQAREVLSGVEKLYGNKPAGIPISPVKKDVDMFFISAINDYLSIKEKSSDDAKLQEYLVSLNNLEDFSDDLKKGIYNSRVDQANKKIDELRNQLPQVFEFYSSYSGFQVLLDDINAQSKMNLANIDFTKKDYESAATHYLAILKQHPRISEREMVLNRLSTSLVAGGEGISPDMAFLLDQKEVDKKAGKIYNTAKRLYDSGNYAQARSTFQSQILEYPTSSYTKQSVDYMERISDAMARQQSVNLDKLRAQQDQQARTLFNAAEQQSQSSKWRQSLGIYEEIIMKYPLSSYHDLSVEQYRQLNQRLLSQIQASNTALANNSALRTTNYLVLTNTLEVIRTNAHNQADESGVNTLLREAETAYNDKDFRTAISSYQKILLKHPGSTNTGLAVNKLDRLYQEVYKVTNGDMAAIQQEQDQQALALYQDANKQLRDKQYRAAVESFSQIILSYPYSSVTDKAVQGIDTAWNQIIQARQADEAAEQKEADKLFKRAVDLAQENKIEEAILSFSDIIVTYPASTHTKDALEYILLNRQSLASNTGMDLASLKEEHNIKARSVYLKAQQAENNKDYKTASDDYARLINDYPLSIYIEESMKGLQRSISSLIESQLRENIHETTTQTAIFLTRNVGRVVDKIGEEIIINIFTGNNLEIGDELYIMRKQNEKILFYVGEATISRISPVMSKAKVSKEMGDINIGDLIFMK